MTQASSNAGSNLPAVLLLIAAAAAGGYYLVSEPLQSTRPAEQPQAAFKSNEFESVEARLWQDPLRPIRRQWQYLIAQRVEKGKLPANATVPPTVTSFARDFARENQPAIGPVLVIAVLTPGGPYADDAEQRRRQRYALVSVLTASDYIPSASTRVGYFVARTPPIDEQPAEDFMRCDGESAASECESITPHILVGYEVYRPIATNLSANWKQILVLWLRGEDFEHRPSVQVESLIAAIRPAGMNASDACGSSPKTPCFGAVMLGPSNSDLLKKMLKNEPGSSRTEKPEATVERYRRHWLETPFRSTDILFGREEPENGPPDSLSPDPQMVPSPCDAECLVNITNQYLDYGLPPSAEQALRACLAQTSSADSRGGVTPAQAECLFLPQLTEVPDSDPHWQTSVHKLVTIPPAALEQSSDEQSFDEQSFDEQSFDLTRKRISSLLLATHIYLDDGIRTLSASDVKELRDCVYPNGLRSETSDIAGCLQDNIVPETESDRSWFTTVANQWRRSNALHQSHAVQQLNTQPQPDGGHLHILSPRATVPIEFLAPQPFNREDYDDLFQYFHPVVASDDAVLEAIVEEMSRRGLDCEAARNIAIVTELDSNYGLLLSYVLEEAIHDVTGCVVTVRSFGYLRGLDGEVTPGPGSSATTNEAGVGRRAARYPAQQANINILPRHDERAVGRSQLDYLRRLADRIGDQHTRLQDVGRRGFSAIGVLGADVYDKQLVIQALRDRLPGLTIFTTDLDARLSDADARKWSRNLIIGSAYGLSLRNEHSRAPPPLRDSYQTAFFRAVQLALRIHSPGSSEEEYASLIRPATPRVFEIGRSGAIDVTVVDHGRRPNAERWRETDALVHGSTGWPSEAGGIQMRLLRVAALSAPLLGLFFYSYWRSRILDAERFRHRQRANMRVAWLSGLSSVLLASILWAWNDSAAEPWLLLEGISTVPTLALQATACVFSVAYIIIGWGWIQQNHLDTSLQFGLERHVRSAWNKPKGLWIRLWSRELAAESTEETSADEIWRRYRQLSGWIPRLVRTVPITLVGIGLVSLTLHFDPVTLISRGQADLFVRIATTVVVVFTVFLCADAIHLSQIYLRALSMGHVDPKVSTDYMHGLDEFTCRKWKAMQLIVLHTEAISPLIILPFSLIFLLLLARSTLFDGWVWTGFLIAIYVGFSIYLLTRAWLFQREAARAREGILQDLKLNLHNYQGDEHKVMRRRINLVISEIQGIHRGAFVPWTRHPILQSIAFPSGGVGLLTVINSLP